jgi:hypothetical protein
VTATRAASAIQKNTTTSMIQKIILFALYSLLLAPCSTVEAQQPRNVPRIGFLSAASASEVAFRTEPFRQGYVSLGM